MKIRDDLQILRPEDTKKELVSSNFLLATAAPEFKRPTSLFKPNVRRETFQKKMSATLPRSSAAMSLSDSNDSVCRRTSVLVNILQATARAAQVPRQKVTSKLTSLPRLPTSIESDSFIPTVDPLVTKSNEAKADSCFYIVSEPVRDVSVRHGLFLTNRFPREWGESFDLPTASCKLPKHPPASANAKELNMLLSLLPAALVNPVHEKRTIQSKLRNAFKYTRSTSHSTVSLIEGQAFHSTVSVSASQAETDLRTLPARLRRKWSSKSVLSDSDQPVTAKDCSSLPISVVHSSLPRCHSVDHASSKM